MMKKEPMDLKESGVGGIWDILKDGREKRNVVPTLILLQADIQLDQYHC